MSDNLQTTAEHAKREAFRQCAAIAQKHAEEWRGIDGSRFAEALHIEIEIRNAGGISDE